MRAQPGLLSALFAVGVTASLSDVRCAFIDPNTNDCACDPPLLLLVRYNPS
jgi:hypothetical protein